MEDKERTVWQLARLAECADPDTLTSEGAQFLRSVENAASEVEDEDHLHEVADSCVPVYTHEIWQTFVDLAAYNEDVFEYGPTDDLTKAASIALYIIAERLLYALVAE